MPFEKVKEFWTQSKALSWCGVVVQGGEFTLHPDAYQIMEFLSENTHKVTLLTNAVEPELAIPLLQFADQLTISLDGPQHDRSRGVAGNLDSIHSLLSQIKDPYKGSTTLQITLGPWNARTYVQAYENIRWFLDVCLEYGAQPRFNIASDDGLLGIASYDQKAEVLTTLYSELITMSNKLEYATMMKSLRSGAQYIMAAVNKKKGSAIPCYSTSIYSTINANGDVWVCQGLDEKDAVLGNLYEKPFDQIWVDSVSRRKELRTCQACTLSCQLTGDLAFINSNPSIVR
jgi:MoaA/NifB/PqqE/SkfB family radical SAM enzyme